MNTSLATVRVQRLLVIVSVCLLLIKMAAWLMTGSVAILTDALESIVNVVAGFIGLYSITLSAKPKDREHPYGHGKVEFLTSAIEGILISIAGLIIIYEGISNLRHPHNLQKMDLGLALIAGSALVNYLVGQYCVKKGHEENSPVLIASGAHLKSDTYSSLGLLIGILLIIVTGYSWIDSVAAMLFAIIILRTGYIIIRKAISGIMDESDDDILHQVVRVLNEHRLPAWIDIHNLRVINYAGFYHIDCHLTVPFYFSVQQGHDVLMSLTDILRMHFKDRVEFFIHVDPCQFAQCSLCAMHECSSRAHDFKGLVIWTEENIRTDANHQHSDA